MTQRFTVLAFSIAFFFALELVLQLGMIVGTVGALPVLSAIQLSDTEGYASTVSFPEVVMVCFFVCPRSPASLCHDPLLAEAILQSALNVFLHNPYCNGGC